MTRLGLRLIIAVSMLLSGGVTTAVAAHGGGGGLSGGVSGSHMGASGLRNTNGPQSLDRDKGLDRAEDRMSASGASHRADRKTIHGKSKGKRVGDIPIR